MTEKENNQQNIIEDLTVNEAEAEEVKGGPIYMKIEGIEGSVTNSSLGSGVKAGYDVKLNERI